MLRITREEAMRGLIDFGRIEDMLRRTQGAVDHVMLDRISPLAAPMLLTVGRVPVAGLGHERLLKETSDALMQAAGLDQFDT